MYIQYTLLGGEEPVTNEEEDLVAVLNTSSENISSHTATVKMANSIIRISGKGLKFSWPIL